MTTFDKREGAFESKFALDEAQKFKAVSRRNRLIAHWAAGLLGKSGADVDAYVKEIIAADLEEGGDEDVVRKLRKDFDAAGVNQSDHQIRRTIIEMMTTAVQQIRDSA
jgi:hypothetical protein